MRFGNCYFTSLLFMCRIFINTISIDKLFPVNFLRHKTMECKKLSDLNTRWRNWNIQVKVMRMWDSVNPTTDELISLDMIMMDDQVCFLIYLIRIFLSDEATITKHIWFFQQGETIHATIWKNLIDTFRSKIIEKSVYAFNNFKVVESTKYRPVSNEIKIYFAYNTKVKEIKGSSEVFPEYCFEFATMDTLEERAEKDTQCSGMFMDVITTSK